METTQQAKEQKQPIKVCVFDNPATMRRECWQDGILQASYDWMTFEATGKFPPSRLIHIGASIGRWKKGHFWGDKQAMKP